jgi:serine/threonine protein kinase
MSNNLFMPRCMKYALKGTNHYMAPELYEEEITVSLAKSDSFSLGVILFNLITGAYPFKSVND